MSLAEHGFTVYALFTGDGTGFDWRAIKPVLIGRRSSNRLRRLFLWPTIIRELRRLRPRIVHFHDPELLPLMCLLQLSAGKSCSYIYDVHEDYAQLVGSYGFPWKLTTWLYQRLVRYSEKRMTLILAEDSYQRLFKRPHEVIHNFSCIAPSKNEVVRENIFLYAGDVSEGRGAFTMVEAFSRLRRTDWKLEIIGRLPELKLLMKLQQLTAQKSLYPNQIEVTDYMPFPQVLERMKKAKVGLCLLSPEPNSVESLPTKVFDYLSAALPVILSDFPYYMHFFAKVPGVHFVNPLDIHAVTIKMKEFCDPKLCEERLIQAKLGRDVCLERFTWETEAPKLLQVYEGLLSDAVETRSRGVKQPVVH
jgi:glycosyltransferase involved in cell wall biosynthesis